MKNYAVHKFYRFWAIFGAFIMLAGVAVADPITLHPRGSDPVTGDPDEALDAGIRLKLSDTTLENRYMPKPVPWGSLPQEDLKALLEYYGKDPTSRQSQQALRFIEPFIAIPLAEKLQKTDIGTTNEVPRLEHPAGRSLFAALGASSAGVLMLLLLYAGNLYAAYTISVFRAQPAGLVCGLAAVVPVLVPIIFLAMPRRQPRSVTEMYDMPDENLEAAVAAEQAATAPAAHAHAAPRHPATQSVAAAGAAAAGKVFARGQFTFNRRFFETQMPGFFAMVRPNADKDMLLIIKSARGNIVAERITRISPNEIFITVRKGHASEEVTIPFNDIQEVSLKHKDA